MRMVQANSTELYLFEV